MVFPSSRPARIPPSTTDSQYDTTTGYSSSSYTRWPRSLTKHRNVNRNANSASRHRHQYQNEPFSDILHYQYSRPQQQQPIHSITSPRRSTLNNLLP